MTDYNLCDMCKITPKGNGSNYYISLSSKKDDQAINRFVCAECYSFVYTALMQRQLAAQNYRSELEKQRLEMQNTIHTKVLGTVIWTALIMLIIFGVALTYRS